MKNTTRLICFLVGLMLLNQPVAAQDLKDYSDQVVRKVNHKLLEVEKEFNTALNLGQSLEGFLPKNEFFMVDNGSVYIEAVATENADQLADELRKLGLQEVAQYGPVVSGYLPISAIKQTAKIESLNFIRPVFKPLTNIGSVTSQGDAAQASDIARTNFGVDGAGVKVGVISDSYNLLNGESTGIQSGDLPGIGNPNGFSSQVQILEEGPEGSKDEGRAMIEIIHDVAPGAEFAFHSGFFSLADFAQGVIELKDAGCQVIVDDVLRATDPWFQDGVISQAIDQVAAEGVTYFSSALNYDRKSYESEFRPAGEFHIRNYGDYILHDFDPGPGVDVFQNISITPDGELVFPFILVLQWDDPFASTCEGCPGADTDLDVFIVTFPVVTPLGILVDRASVANNIGQDALEGFEESLATNVTSYLVVGKRKDAPGPNPDPGRIKYINYLASINEYQTNSETSTGHVIAEGGIGVGAASYTTVSSSGPPTIEDFSSAGGVAILFDKNGNPIPAEVRNKPEIVAPDDVNTSFFVAGRDIEGDGFPNFNGTSAASPHAAGVAALMIEASNFSITPQEIEQALINTAIDMDDPFTSGFDQGFDFKTGYGFIQADDAIADALPFGAARLSSGEESNFMVSTNPVVEPKLKIVRKGEVDNDGYYHLELYNHLGQKVMDNSIEWPAGQEAIHWEVGKVFSALEKNELFMLKIHSGQGKLETIKLIRK